MDARLLNKLDNFEALIPEDLSLDLPSFDDARPASLSAQNTDLLADTPLPLAPRLSAEDEEARENELALEAQTAREAQEFELKIKQAYEAGLAAGRKETTLEEGAFADSIGATLSSFDKTITALRTEITQQQSDLAANILKALLPASMKSQAGYEVTTLIYALLDKAAYGKVIIHIPPQMTAEFTRQIGPYQDRIQLFENTSLKMGMSRLKWQGGGIDIDLNKALKLCLECLHHATNKSSDTTSQKVQETGL